MKIKKEAFGVTRDGKEATLYTMTNANGMSVSVTDFGANIVRVIVPDAKQNNEDVVLGYDTVTGYESNGPGYGSFIGRHANRIGGARVVIDGTEYLLEKNDGENNLHSGSKGYNKCFYEAELYEEQETASVEFSRVSPDMEQGFPGNLDLSVTYSLNQENELTITYWAVSDKDTLVNFTNHSYFNLAGQASGSVLNQQVMVLADQFTPTADDLIPTGEYVDVTGTPMDFRERKPLGREIEADYQPLVIAGGYDHNYVLRRGQNEDVTKVAELWDEESGRLMEVFTDLPGMQLYSGNFIKGNESGKGGHVYERRDGVCFETQYYPNACNLPDFPSCLLKAGVEYESVTIYKFSVRA